MIMEDVASFIGKRAIMAGEIRPSNGVKEYLMNQPKEIKIGI
jgi:hypothetical protein